MCSLRRSLTQGFTPDHFPALLLTALPVQSPWAYPGHGGWERDQFFLNSCPELLHLGHTHGFVAGKVCARAPSPSSEPDTEAESLGPSRRAPAILKTGSVTQRGVHNAVRPASRSPTGT